MRRLVAVVLFCLISFPSLWAAGEIRIVVEAGSYDRTDCVVSTGVSSLDLKGDLSAVVLYERIGKKRIKVSCQLLREKDGTPHLYWILTGKTPAGTMREFIAERSRHK